MKKIAVHLAEGFEEIEAVSIIDVLRRAGLEVVTVSVTGNLKVIGSHQITIIADQLFENTDYQKIDMIVLPGGMPGSANLNKHNELKQRILEFSYQNKFLGAICAAPIVFGGLGILNNKKATCYPGFELQLPRAKLSNKKVETDGIIITGKGAGTAIEFSLKIVELLIDKETAIDLARKMIFD